jgi:hypothetical protein
MQQPRPTRDTINMSQTADGTFDQDAYAVMNMRDNALIESEILYGQGSSKFVYQFSIGGSGTVSGISVVGARHLAAHYGGMRHKLIGSMQKQGSLFTFTSFPQAGVPMAVSCQVVPELADEDDFYGAIVEVTDTRTGNMIQVEKRENRFEKKRDGSYFERPHFAIIAQSKAYRNAVLTLIPQDIQVEWRENMLKLAKTDVITTSILDEKRAGVLRFATSKGLAINRLGVDKLTMDQIAGLSDAAREGVASFKVAALSCGILRGGSFVQLPSAGTASAATSGPAPTVAPTPLPTPTPAPIDAPRHTPSPTSAPTPAPTLAPVASARAFAEYMADEVGEMIMDGEDAMVFTDPVAFANCLSNLMVSADPAARKMLFENNQEGIWQAIEISDEARSILDTWRAVSPLPKSAAASDPVALVIPMKGDRQDFIAFGKTVKAALAAITSMVDIDGWIETNGPTIAKMPSVARRQIEKAILERQAEIQPRDEAHRNTPTAAPTPAPTDAPVETVDRDAATCQGFLAEIAACRTFDDILFWSKQAIPKAVVRRWVDERPDLFKLIDDAVVARKPAEG